MFTGKHLFKNATYFPHFLHINNSFLQAWLESYRKKYINSLTFFPHTLTGQNQPFFLASCNDNVWKWNQYCMSMHVNRTKHMKYVWMVSFKQGKNIPKQTLHWILHQSCQDTHRTWDNQNEIHHAMDQNQVRPESDGFKVSWMCNFGWCEYML